MNLIIAAKNIAFNSHALLQYTVHTHCQVSLMFISPLNIYLLLNLHILSEFYMPTFSTSNLLKISCLVSRVVILNYSSLRDKAIIISKRGAEFDEDR